MALWSPVARSASAAQSARSAPTPTPPAGFSYPAGNPFVGTDSFTYRAANSRGLASNIATATISVVDPPPTCADFNGSVAPGGSVSIGNPLHPICSDPDGNPFS